MSDLPQSSRTAPIRQHLGALARGQLQVASIFGPSAAIHTAELSRDGLRVVTTSEDDSAQVWDTVSGKCLTTIRLTEVAGKGPVKSVWRASPGPGQVGGRVRTAVYARTNFVDSHVRPIRLVRWDLDLGAHPQPNFDAAQFSEDGSRVVTFGNDPSTARVWEANEGRLLGIVKAGSRLEFAAFSPDATRVVVASSKNSAQVLAVDDGRTLAVLTGHRGDVYFACFSQNGSRILTASKGGTISVWNADDMRFLASLEVHTRVSWVLLSPDGSRVAAVEQDEKAIRLWRADDGHFLGSLAVKRFDGGTVRFSGGTVQFSPDGSRVLAVDLENVARLWNTDDGRKLAEFRGHANRIEAVAFDPSGDHIATTSSDEVTRIWSTETGQFSELQGELGRDARIVFDASGIRVLFRMGVDKIQLARSAIPHHVVALRTHAGTVWGADFSPDGKRIVTASDDRVARVSNAETGAVQFEIRCPDPVTYAEFSHDGSRIATAGNDGKVRLWRSDSGDLLKTISAHEEPIFVVSFNHDDSRILTASHDKTARLWTTSDGRLQAILVGHQDPVYYASFSPDGSHVVSASGDKTARIWSTPDLTTTITPRENAKPSKITQAIILKDSEDVSGLNTAVFSPDGRQVLTASASGVIRLWNSGDGRQINEFKLAGGSSLSAVFSPDGTQIVTASDDGAARIWRAQDGRLLNVLRGHQSGLFFAAFSPSGTRVVTASRDGTSSVWKLDPLPGKAHTLVLWAEALTGTELRGDTVVRHLSPSEWAFRDRALRGQSGVAPPEDWVASLRSNK